MRLVTGSLAVAVAALFTLRPTPVAPDGAYGLRVDHGLSLHVTSPGPAPR